MKGCTIVPAMMLSLLALVLLGGCGPGEYTPKANEELYGTWVNEKTGLKLVWSPDGSFSDYSLSSTANTPVGGGKWKIRRKWNDSEGNVFYETFATFTFGNWEGSDANGTTLKYLEKVSKSGSVLERNWWFTTSDFPKAIDPKGAYFIYYRAKE